MNQTVDLIKAIHAGDKPKSDQLFRSVMIEKIKVEADLKKRDLAQELFKSKEN